MESDIRLYNAGTGMDQWEKAMIVQFLQAHNSGVSYQSARDAVDCVLKQTPSFGGFILTDWSEKRLRALVMVNRTGMSGFGPDNLISFAVVNEAEECPMLLLEKLIRQAIHLSDGEIAFHLPKRHPAIKFFQGLGFQQDYIELRFSGDYKKVSA